MSDDAKQDAIMRLIQANMDGLAREFSAHQAQQHVRDQHTADGLATMRAAMDKLADQVQALDLRWRGESEERRKEWMAEAEKLWTYMKQVEERLHERISSAGREAKADSRGAKAEVMSFLRDWLPLIVLGIIVAFYGISLGGGN